MRLPAPPSRPVREPIGPLVDVVFLLLVFFLLAGTLERVPPLRVEPPRSQSARTESGEHRPLTLLLAGDGRVGLDGEVVDPGEVASRLAVPVAEQPGRPVRLIADAEAGSGGVLMLLAELRRLGAGEIALMTRPAAAAEDGRDD